MDDDIAPADVAALYDEWADDYEAMHADWDAAVVSHGELLREVLTERGVARGASLVDCTCGIGTQAIGLALAGFDVTGHDISAREIELAREAAVRAGVDASFAVSDLLQPPAAGSARFDAVVTANSLTHFADVATLGRALRTMHALTRPEGVVAITNRDYDIFDLDGLGADGVGHSSTTTPVQQSVRDGIERLSFQRWTWTGDATSYRMETFLVTRTVDDPLDHDASQPWTTRTRTTHLRAWRRAEMEAAVLDAGFAEPQWHETSWQPILTAVARVA